MTPEFTKERDALRATNRQLAEANAALTARVAEFDAVCESLHQTRAEAAGLETDLKEARTLNAQLAAQVDDARRQRDECAESLSRAKDFVTDRRAIFTASEPEAGELDRVIEAFGGKTDGFFDLVAHLRRQRRFSEKTFGPGARTKGVIQHIRKELLEIENDPTDVEEWVDVVLLALDGAWRAGWTSDGIAKAIEAKQTKNEGRTWPDWRTASPDAAIEHDRTSEPTPLAAVTTHTEAIAVTAERVADLDLIVMRCGTEEMGASTDEAVALITALLADGRVHSAWLHGRGGK